MNKLLMDQNIFKYNTLSIKDENNKVVYTASLDSNSANQSVLLFNSFNREIFKIENNSNSYSALSNNSNRVDMKKVDDKTIKVFINDLEKLSIECDFENKVFEILDRFKIIGKIEVLNGVFNIDIYEDFLQDIIVAIAISIDSMLNN